MLRHRLIFDQQVGGGNPASNDRNLTSHIRRSEIRTENVSGIGRVLIVAQTEEYLISVHLLSVLANYPVRVPGHNANRARSVVPGDEFFTNLITMLIKALQGRAGGHPSLTSFLQGETLQVAIKVKKLIGS